MKSWLSSIMHSCLVLLQKLYETKSLPFELPELICIAFFCWTYSLQFSFFALSPQKTYATAVYENIADSPEELAFRRGDILEVLERDTNGMVGWWLCMLRGRKVI